MENSMIFKGLKFGMLLQLAVGPMCLLVFRTSTVYGFLPGLCLVSAIALMDALYIALSCVGAASVINRAGVRATIKLISCVVLVLFGINTISDAFHISLLPAVSLFSNVFSQNLFLQGLLLTASNPLTILFWSGMFSAQVIENKWDKKQLFFFACGCVLSTLLFLTAVSLLGSIVSDFLPDMVIQALNVIVGVFLVFFGIRLLFKKEQQESKNKQPQE